LHRFVAAAASLSAPPGGSVSMPSELLSTAPMLVMASNHVA
jgi:hypothetical protein